MKSLKRVLFAGLFFSSLFLNAETKKIPMSFQADKNNIQVLPQRFEYSLLDENRIKIGDILIDSTTFGFQMGPSAAARGMFRARFLWPHGLVKNGSISIRNNTGKTIWTTPIREQDVKLVKRVEPADTQKSNAHAMLRSQLAELAVDRLSPELIEEMKYLPFMSFCISKASENTRINLCSREVYLSIAKGKMAVKPRSQGKREGFVEVNGRTVSNQGIVFLNDETQNIGFRSISESGAMLEIETRMKPVDFKDVIFSEDKKNLILTAVGTQPVSEENVQRISDTEWRATLDAARPVLYLKGAGDIPMRQEFYIQGEVPQEIHRPFLNEDSLQRIYGDHVDFSGTQAEGTTVSTNDKSAKVEVKGNSFRWWVQDIPAGQTSREYLQVTPSFTARYDIHREFAWELDFGLKAFVPAIQGAGYGAITWWAENFLGIESPWSQLHWGIHAEETTILNQKDTEANLSVGTLEVLWRAVPGFHYVDPTWGISAIFANVQSPGPSGSTFGVGAFYSAPPLFWLSDWFSWQETTFRYLMPTTNGISLTQGVQLETLLYRNLNYRWSFHTGFGASLLAADPGPSNPQAVLKAGATFKF